jgi:hypothetical protein
VVEGLIKLGKKNSLLPFLFISDLEIIVKVIETPNCWRCGQPLSHPDSRFCDRCGASVSTPSDAFYAREEDTDFDRMVAILFAITGLAAIIIGIVGGVAFLGLMEGMPGVATFSALAVVVGLVVGGVFLFLAYRIKEKR